MFLAFAAMVSVVVGFLWAWSRSVSQAGGWKVLFKWPGLARGSRFRACTTPVLGEVPSAQAGVAAGIVNSALQIGAAVSTAGIGSLFFSVLGDAADERGYAWAFAVAQWTLTAALFAAMLIAIPGRQAQPASAGTGR